MPADRPVENDLRKCLITGLLAIAVGIACDIPSDAASPRPNMVFILADDLGYGDVKCFGQDRCLIQTPHFDRLAREGVRFTDAHSVAPVCVPSRVAIMTGRYPWRIQGARENGPWGYLTPRLPLDHFTLGNMLQSAGYVTGYVGKWHLGTEMTTRDDQVQGPENVDYRKPLRIGPKDYGFDSSFILPGSLDMFPYAFVRNGNWVGSVTARKGWSAFNRVGPAAEDFVDTKVLSTWNREARRFLESRAEEPSRPFFLYLALTSPHTPISPSEKFEGHSSLGLYGDFVAETDDCVGQLLHALDELGLTDNTIVWATSDHGPASYAGNIRKATPGQVHDLEQLGHYPAGIYRGYKFSVYEGGHRVPLIVRWPAVIPAGTTCQQLIGLQDLCATVADILEIDLADHQAADSFSCLPLLKEPASRGTRRTMIVQAGGGWAIRDGRWKLCVCPGSGASGQYGNAPPSRDAWQAAVERFGRRPTRDELRHPVFVQLFDLETDPSEKHNLAEKHPQRVEQLFAVLDAAINRGRTTPGPDLSNDTRRIEVHRGVPGFVTASGDNSR